MKVYLIINETDFGPIFSTEEKALEFLGVKNMEELDDYPSIEEIILDDINYNRDR